MDTKYAHVASKSNPRPKTFQLSSEPDVLTMRRTADARQTQAILDQIAYPVGSGRLPAARERNKGP